MAEDSGMEMPAFSSHSTPRRVLKGHMKNTSTLTKLCATLNIHYSDMMQEILRFTGQTAADDRRLPADPTELGLLYYPSGNSLHNYARGICHHRGEHISEPKLPE